MPTNTVLRIRRFLNGKGFRSSYTSFPVLAEMIMKLGNWEEKSSFSWACSQGSPQLLLDTSLFSRSSYLQSAFAPSVSSMYHKSARSRISVGTKGESNINLSGVACHDWLKLQINHLFSNLFQYFYSINPMGLVILLFLKHVLHFKQTYWYICKLVFNNVDSKMEGWGQEDYWGVFLGSR